VLFCGQCDDAAEVGKVVKALLTIYRQKMLLQPICCSALAELITKVRMLLLLLLLLLLDSVISDNVGMQCYLLFLSD